MTSRFGFGTALVAIAMTAATASTAGASPPYKSRGAVDRSGAAAALQQAYTPRVALPGDASTAGVQADARTWMVNARAGADARAIARRFGARAIGFASMGAFVIRRDRARAFSSALRARGLLRSAGPNVVRHRQQIAPAADPLTAQQWWRPAVVNPATPTPPVDPATSPKLGLVDSMPDLNHPEWAGSNFTSLGAGTVPPEVGIGHGTATASVAAAPVNGVGIIGIWPGMSAVNSPFPSDQILCADSVRGIVAVLQAGAKVINMSYGSPSPCDAEYLALQAAVALGAIPVASAGNELAEGNPAEFPASYPHVLTIAAINQAGRPRTSRTRTRRSISGRPATTSSARCRWRPTRTARPTATRPSPARASRRRSSRRRRRGSGPPAPTSSPIRSHRRSGSRRSTSLRPAMTPAQASACSTSTRRWPDPPRSCRPMSRSSRTT